MSDTCIDCGASTAWGSGKYVNRVPADGGYLCADCMSFECDRCNVLIDMDCEIRHNGNFYCDVCADELGVTDHGL